MSSTQNRPTDDVWGDDDLDDLNINELGKILDDPLPKTAFQTLRTNEQNVGFNNNTGQSWMFPSNMPLRAYQQSITQAALYKNTLVALPTGLGKTFIAAVVMYNFFRWYPRGKVIFVAPTRPLVTQQIAACKNIMPFPAADTMELTGKLQREKRLACWKEKRVFFATPQALQADMISQDDFPFQQVKLIVVDEAHRAKGRYAYVEVVQALYQRNKYFRILALSATPGRTMEDVAEVVRNLLISHLEVRCDNSIDVMPYIHKRNIKTIVVKFGEEIERVREQMIKIIDPYLRQLIEADVISGSHQNITRNFLVMEQKRFRERSFQQPHAQKSIVTSNFSICISLFHALELLERHGLRVFLNSFEDDEEGRPKFILAMNPSLRNLVEQLRTELGPNPFDVLAQPMTNGRIAEIPKNLDFGHPKFEEARKCILAHFEQNSESRAIVFCEYRESVMLIYRLLLQHMPVLNPRCFVGQGGTTGSLRALSQNQQIQIMNDFRAGKSNILIATSIGEEGIDVGEVDLIVCFDINTSNPIRFVQRIGRTGRQKNGKVLILVTEGKEQKILQDVLANKDQTNKKILRSSIVQNALYKQSPRMVPTEFNPECIKIHVKPDLTITGKEKKTKSTKTEIAVKKTKKPSKPTKERLVESTQDLRKFFKKLEEDENNSEEFESNITQVETPAKTRQQRTERVESIFKHLQPCHSSNTPLDDEMPTTSAYALKTSETPKIKLDTHFLKKLNKFLKSSTDITLPIGADHLLIHLQSEKCSKAAKMFMLKKSYKKIREISEQMEILQALNVEEVNDMSTHELEIRQTYQSILDLFENSAALQRFLEDAELDELAAKKRQMEKAAALDDWDMTQESFQQVKSQIFEGLDLQGPSWDNFDYRFEALKRTKAYQKLIAEKSKVNTKDPSVVANSMVFDAVPVESTFTNDTNDLEDTTFNSLPICDSKYASQWETDFQPNRVTTKSTPMDGAIVKAFDRQKSKQISARKRLETLNETAFESDDDDLIFLPLGSEVFPKNCDIEITRNLRPSKVIEASFLQRQQSTPLQKATNQQTSKETINEPSLQHVLDLDLEQAFSEPFPEEIEMLNKDKVDILSGSTSKENSKPKAEKASTTRLFEMLESKPVNSVLTPKRSVAKITSKFNEILTKQSASKNAKEASAEATPKEPTKFCSTQRETFFESSPQSKISIESSPPNRLRASTKAFEKSPSIFITYTKGLQRMESRKAMEVKNAAVAENSYLDSPLVVKRKRNAQNLKRNITDSDIETPNCNSDDDFEEVKASPKAKRQNKQNQKGKPLRWKRLCEFFDDEAEKSGGSGHSDEDCELEKTLGNFVCDSIIVDGSDDDEMDGAPTATQMHAVYLQSVNSTNQRQRGFKIPAPRQYDINVYSQYSQVPVEPSQYGLDSFVVHEDEEENLDSAENETLCPLEKAENILKERRREAKRRRNANDETENPPKKLARKCYQLNDSSDSSDGGG